MRRLFVAVLSLFSTGCFTMTLPGPGGVSRVMPFAGTMIVRIYNYCSPILRAEGNDHLIEIPYGESRELVLPQTIASSDQQKTTIFTAMTKDRKFLGVLQEYFYPDYNANVTRKQYVVGGQYRHIYDSYGRDACRQGG
jgi:hypothetical protein